MKNKQEIIQKFNEQVNMSVDELEKWLDSPESHKAGTGVGIESGRKIVEILRRNPNMDPDQFHEEDMAHMQRVVFYNTRHLAQEDRLKETKTPTELEKTKSTISLRNWGHDPLKELKGRKRKESESASVPGSQVGGENSSDEVTRALEITETTKPPPAKKTKVDVGSGSTRKGDCINDESDKSSFESPSTEKNARETSSRVLRSHDSK